MAGSYAKIFNEIWADPDFRSLNRGQQWLFFALISQPELNFAGVVTTTDRRLTGCAEGFTVEELRDDLTALHARRYIVFDEEHDEILVRSYVRHDGAWRTPNVLTSIIRAATSIRSVAIRAALAEELGRLALDELSGKRADEMRASVARVIETLTPRVPVRVSRTVSACVSEPFQEGISEPFAQPITEPTVVVAVVVEEVEDRTSLSLFEDLPPTAGSGKPRPEVEVTSQTIVGEWIERCKKRPPNNVIGQMSKQIKTMLDEGIAPDDIRRGISVWMTKEVHPSVLPSLVNSAMNATSAAGKSAASNGSGSQVPDRGTYNAAKVFKNRKPA